MPETEEEAALQAAIDRAAEELLALEAGSDELLAFAITDPIVARQQVLVQESEKVDEANLKQKAAEDEAASARPTPTPH